MNTSKVFYMNKRSKDHQFSSAMQGSRVVYKDEPL